MFQENISWLEEEILYANKNMICVAMKAIYLVKIFSGK